MLKPDTIPHAPVGFRKLDFPLDFGFKIVQVGLRVHLHSQELFNPP